MKALLALSLAALALVGCQFPQDTDGTTDRIERDHVLRAGISERDPFVILEPGRPPAGSEVRLVEGFARTLGARVEWIEGSEEEHVDALKEGAIDVMASGLTSKSRWKKDVALTRPYLTTEAVVGVPVGASYPTDLQRAGGRRAGQRSGRPRRTQDQRDVTPVDQLEPGGPAAVGDWLLGDLRLMPMTVLKNDKHVMAVKNGENELLVRLERFLLNREGQDSSTRGRGGPAMTDESGRRPAVRAARGPAAGDEEGEPPRVADARLLRLGGRLLALTLGQSQAMKAAWIEDLLGFLPPTAFLIAARFRKRPPSGVPVGPPPLGVDRLPGRRSRCWAWACRALRLRHEARDRRAPADRHDPAVRPEVWLGWLMLVALVVGDPPRFLGIRKRKLADSCTTRSSTPTPR